MGGFAAQFEIAEIIAVEWGAPAGEVFDTGGGFSGDAFGGAVIDNTSPGHFGIDGMGVAAVAAAHRRRDAALRPG